MSTISDVAKRAGVSTMTVSRVINNSGYISQKTRERVEQAIAELDYVPNALARHLRFKQTKTLALILTDITNPFFTTIARGVEDVARQHGYCVIFCNTDESVVEEVNYLNVLLQRQVDGILLVPTTNSDASIKLVRSRKVPLVVLDRWASRQRADQVRCDSKHASRVLMKHLLDLGHTQIAMISGPSDVSTAADRAEGYKQALEDAGLPFDKRLVLFGEFNGNSGYDLTRRLLADAPPFTALFAANNMMCFGAFRALREAGVHVPSEMSLVTFDDLPLRLIFEPFLTVVNQPAYELGQRATELLFQRLENTGPAELQDVVLSTELVVRSSTAPPTTRPIAKP